MADKLLFFLSVSVAAEEFGYSEHKLSEWRFDWLS